MEQVLLSGYLIVLSVFDGRECKVPIGLIKGGFLVTFVFVLWRCIGNPTEWKWYVLAALLGMLPGMFFLGMSYITGKVGAGDGLVMMVVGMLVGYKECLMLVAFSLLLMSIWCIGILCSRRGNRHSRIPYLPFITVVYMISLLV